MIRDTVVAIGWMTTAYFVFVGLRAGFSMLFKKQGKDRSWYEQPIFSTEEIAK